jgi:hypothetical protein
MSQIKPPPKVNHPQKIDGLVVEEELVKLILELNPQVKYDAKSIVAGKRQPSEIPTVGESSSSMAQDSLPYIPFEPMSADYGEHENIRSLINLLPTQPPAVNPLHRERLLRFFERFAKYRLPTVSSLLRRYEGHEHALFASLVAEYGPEPTINDPDYFHEGMPSLPEGWCRVESSRGDIYYKQLETMQVSWTRPREASIEGM